MTTEEVLHNWTKPPSGTEQPAAPATSAEACGKRDVLDALKPGAAVRPSLSELQDLERTVVGALEPQMCVGCLEFVSLRANAVWVDRERQAVVRVNLAPMSEQFVAERLRLVTRLGRDGVPVLVPLSVRPAALGAGKWATLWPLGRIDRPPDGSQLGKMLQAMHAAPGRYMADSWLDAELGRAAANLAAAARVGVPERHLRAIATRVRDASDALHRLWPCSEDRTSTVVFGDPGPNNTVWHSGRHKWIDPDTIGIGPREVDFGVMSAYAKRFRGRDTLLYKAVRDTCGTDINENLVDRVARMTEASLMAWLAAWWRLEPGCRAEVGRRIETFDEPAKWLTTRELNMRSVRGHPTT